MWRQAKIGVAVISVAKVAQMIIAGCECPKTKPAVMEAPKIAMKYQWYRKVANHRSGLAESPLGVTTNLLLRRRAESTSALAYSGADSADITMPATPPEPSGSCGETLWRRVQTDKPIFSAEGF